MRFTKAVIIILSSFLFYLIPSHVMAETLKYNRSKAIEYVKEYCATGQYNVLGEKGTADFAYRKYPGVDCANFMSQALIAGGLNFNCVKIATIIGTGKNNKGAKGVVGADNLALVLEESFCFKAVNKTEAKDGDILSWGGHVGMYSGGYVAAHTTDYCFSDKKKVWGSPVYFQFLDDKCKVCKRDEKTCKAEPKGICNQCSTCNTETGNCDSKCTLSIGSGRCADHVNCKTYGWLGLSVCYNYGPGGDCPDDTFTVGTVVPSDNRAVYPTEQAPVGVLDNGYPYAMLKAMETFGQDARLVPIDGIDPNLVAEMPLLIIPTGGLMDVRDSEFFKSSLTEYVKRGGTVLVLSQQHGADFAVIPGRLTAFGWQEDQSCQASSAYIDTWHQMLAGQTLSTPSINLDGYFTAYPDNTTVLLRRTANGQAALITYPYENGRIIATSAFTDYAYTSNQASSDELRLLRDIISWAVKSDTLPEIKPGQSTTVNLTLTNNDATNTSTAAEIELYDPDRKEIKFSTKVPVTLAPGQNTQVPLAYVSSSTDPLGIYHVKYNLLSEGYELLTSELDPEGTNVWVEYLLQPPAEEPSGRFAVSNPPTGTVASKDIWLTVTSPNQEVVYGEPFVYTFHVFNNTSSSRNLRIKAVLPHTNRQHEWNITATASGETTLSGSDLFLDSDLMYETMRAYLYDENGAQIATYMLSFKGIYPSVGVTTQTNKRLYAKGETVNLSVTLQNRKSASYTTSLRVRVLDPSNVSVFDQGLNITLPANGTNTQSMSFALSSSAQGGVYAVVSETYDQSGNKIGGDNISFELPLTQISVIPNIPQSLSQGSNTITFNMTNIGKLAVASGSLAVILKDPSGTVVSNISQPFSLGLGETKTLSTVMSIPELKFGSYTLSYTQSDETKTGKPVSLTVSNSAGAALSFDKSSYRIRETVILTLDIRNSGKFNLDNMTVTVSVPDAAYSFTQTASIAYGQTQPLQYAIPLPVTMTAGQHAVTVTLALPSGSTTIQNSALTVPDSNLVLAYSGSPNLTAGDTIHLTIENSGGVDTSYTTERIVLSDSKGMIIYQGSASGGLLAGEKKTLIDIPLSAQLAQGILILNVLARDTRTAITESLDRTLTVTGLSAVLETKTAKDIYLKTESITGNSKITNGTLGITDGSLKISVGKTIAGHGQVEDISGLVSPVLGSASIYHLAVAGNDIYIGASSGQLLRFNTISSTVTDLSNKIASFWGGNSILTMAYDSINKVVYLGAGYNGKFARYNTSEYTGGNSNYPAMNTAYDLSSKFGLGAQYSLRDMVFDFKRGDIYTTVTNNVNCGGQMLYEYSPSTNTARGNINSCSNPCQWPPNACATWSLAFDFDTDTLFAGGRGTMWGGLHTYSLTNGTFSRCITGSSITDNMPTAMVYDSAAKAIYFGGSLWDSSGGDFIKYDIASRTKTNLTYKLTALWGGNNGSVNNINAAAYDSNNKVVYLGKEGGKLARYNTPLYLSNTHPEYPNADTAYLINLSSTSWGGNSIRSLDYDPSSQTVYLGGDSSRFARFRFVPSSYNNIFETTIPITQSANTIQDYLTSIGVLNTTGKLYLTAEMKNSLGQTIATSVYPFYVVEGNTLLLFSTNKKIYRLGETVTIAGEVRNLSSVAASGLTMKLNSVFGMQSTQIYSSTFNLPANGSYPFSVTTTAGQEGTYTLTGKVTQNNSTLVEISDQYDVSNPSVTATVSGPDTVGNEPFNMNLEFKNSGKVDTNIHYVVSNDQGIVLDDQQLTISAGESKLIQFNQEITSNASYAFVLTGDLNQTLTKPVAYGLSSAMSVYPQSIYAEGSIAIPVTVTNTGQLDENVAITFNLQPSGFSQSKSYFITQGGTVSDTLYYDNLTEGSYQLVASSQYPSASAQAAFQVMKAYEITETLTVGANTGGAIPVIVGLTNAGFNSIEGTVRLSAVDKDGQAAWIASQDVTGLGSQNPQSFSFSINSSTLVPGTYTLQTDLLDSGNQQLSSASQQISISAASFQITQVPSYQTFYPGQQATLTFIVKNTGGLEGEASLNFKAYDLIDSTQNFWLKPGEEKTLAFSLAFPDDLEEKDYFADYTLTPSSGDGVIKGQVKYHLAGINLNVNATLDKQYYSEGETAHLTITVSGQSGTGNLDLFARANYKGFEGQKAFTLPSTVTFDIPLQSITGEKLFYGIYHEGGRSIYLNSLYIYKTGDALNITTSKQVYNPGESVTASISSQQSVAGTMTVSGPGNYSETFVFSGSASTSFGLPATMTAGTYVINAELQTDAGTLTASHPIDVAGIQVKVTECKNDKGKYAVSDTVTTDLTISSNTAMSATLKTWIIDPEGKITQGSEKAVALTSSENTLATTASPFSTGTSGIHRLLYGIYDGDLLLASGSEAFDVGDAVLLGLTTDKTDYPTNSEPVNIKTSVYGTVDSSLEIYLDGSSVNSQSVSSSGFSSVETSLGSVTPGSHTLKAVLRSGGLTSTKETTFVYGSSLPDLAVSLNSQAEAGLDGSLEITATVTNQGKSMSSSTRTAIYIDGSFADTVSVNSLNAGESQQLSFIWNVSGQAGSHVISAVVDPDNQVAEFNEGNNSAEISINIPDVSPVSSPTNLDSQVLTGTILPGSTVTVTSTTGTVGEVTYPTATTWSVTLSNLQSGNNVITITVTDSSGSRSVSINTLITVDTTPPAGSITINSGASYTNTVDVTLTLQASDSSSVSHMCLSNTNDTCTQWEDYATSKTWTLPSGDGLKTVNVWFKDNVGNSNEMPHSASITLDTIAPVLTVSTLSDGSWTNNNLLNVSGIATDENGIPEVDVNGISVSTTSTGSLSYPFALNEGPNTITVTATDKAENKTIDVRNINLDSTAPALVITEPADSLKTTHPSLTVRGYVDESSTVTVKLEDGEPVPAVMDGLSFSMPINLKYGYNTFEVTAKDSVNSSSQKRTVIFDDQAPGLSVTNPAQDIETTESEVTIKGEVTDVTSSTVTITVNDVPVFDQVISNGSFQQPITFTEEGPYYILVRAVDELGFKSEVQRNVVFKNPLSLPQMILTPTSSSNELGKDQTVTAQVLDNSGSPLVGVPIIFDVLSGPNAYSGGYCSINAMCNTDSSGRVSFTYSGLGGVGTDIVSACYISQAMSGAEACSQATIDWINPTCDSLSSIASNFNGTSIASGNYVWFNSIVKVNNRGTNPAILRFAGSRIQFTAGGRSYDLAVPGAEIIFSQTATMASTVFEGGIWVTTVPVSYSGNVFLTGLPYLIPAGGLPGGINPVSWSGYFLSDMPGLSAQWKWAAAVYTGFSSDTNALGIKAIDGNTPNLYNNSDHAGTPESYKSYVIGGARGGGGSNYTGSYSGTASKTPCGF